MGNPIPQREWAILGVVRALAIFAAAVATPVAAASLQRDHSIANNVMQQKGSFSMPGKRK